MHAHFKKEVPRLLNVERVTPLVTRVMGFNPGPFTLQGTNTYLVGGGPSRILVDTGEGGRPDYVSALGSVLEKERARITTIVLTHWHGDHVGGLADVLQSKHCSDDAAVYKMAEPRHDPRVFARLGAGAPSTVRDIVDGDRIGVSDATLRALRTPGHTKDGVCFLLEEEQALFSGDIVLGTGSSHFSQLTEYMASLRRLLDESRACGGVTVCPSHGPVLGRQDGAGQAKIEEYIKHREQRDVQIVACLEAAGSGAELTAAQITARLYHDVPKHLHRAAETNVVLHLLKLAEQGRAEGRREADAVDAKPVSLGGKTQPDELSDIFIQVAPWMAATWRVPAPSAL